MYRFASISMFIAFALATAGCVGNSNPDCGDPDTTSESHWANCGQNGATNLATNGAANNASDAGNVGNNATTNNAGSNNAVVDAGAGSDAGDDAGPDAGGDAGDDAGQLETCWAYRWSETDLAFDQARCTDTGAGTFDCSCFDLGDTMSIAVTCDQALAECGATRDELDGCAMTDQAGCTQAADGGWECSCQGGEGLVPSDAERCDSAYYASCYTEDFCESSFTDGTARCTPVLDQDYAATGYSCACYVDNIEVKPASVLSGASCVDDASAYCAEL